MSKQTQMAFAFIFLLLGIGFTEIFLATKHSQLDYKFKILTRKLKNSQLLKNTLENQLDKKLEANKLLRDFSFKTFKKALPKDILVVKFRNQDDNNAYFVQKE